MEYLYLDGTEIKKIKGLESLYNLKSLSLAKTKITEIEGLENLKHLRSLNIEETDISQKLIEELGGINSWGEVYSPKKFVEYSKNIKD